MLTEIRPGTFQTMIHNILWTFRAKDRKEAEENVKWQTEKFEKRQAGVANRKLWSARRD